MQMKEAETLKAEANKLYAAKNHLLALSAYMKITTAGGSGLDPEFCRIIRCNIAACFLELVDYNRCIDQCRIVINTAPSTDPSAAAITKKAYFRLAKSLNMLGKYEEALQVFEDMKKANIDSNDQAKALRNEIIANEQARLRQKTDQPQSTSSSSAEPMVSHIYQVKIGEHVHNFQELVPPSLCVEKPQRTASELYLSSLALKHNKELANAHLYECVICGRQNVKSLRHCPISWLHASPPFVVNFAQPVCFGGGPCDRAAEKEFLSTMDEIKKGT